MSIQLVPLFAEERFYLVEQLLNAVKQAVLAVDLSGRIVLWNQTAVENYGWTFTEIQDRNISDFFATPLLMETVKINSEMLRQGKNWIGEFPVNHRDHTNFTANFMLSFIQLEQHGVIGIIGISASGLKDAQLAEANFLLAEARSLLSDAVDYEAPLTTLAKLAVPQLADWCAVHLLQEDGSVEQVAVAPAETTNFHATYDWLVNHLPTDETNGLPAVLRSGEPKLVTDVATNLWASAASIKSYMIVPLITHPQTLGAITFVTAESGRRFDRNALALAENLVSHIAIYLDKARLYRESQRLNTELEQRVSDRTVELSTALGQLIKSEETVKTLFRISTKLNATLKIETILDDLAQEAIQMVKGQGGFAGLRITEGMNVRKVYQDGKGILFDHTWRFGEGIPGWVLEHKIPYGTSDATNDPIMDHSLAINSNVHSTICTPILDSAGEVLGFFDIRNKQNSEGFTINDQEMLMALAPVASIAIQNALAYQQRISAEAELKSSFENLRQLAANLESVREEERTQIARELHDQLGQALTAMKFDLAWLAARLTQKDADLAQKAKTITAQMDTMIKTVRRIATELRPGMLDDLGLAASIEWQARDFEKRTGIVCEVNLSAEEIPLARAQSVALFRIFQESLTNTVRHANAQHIDVSLSNTNDRVTLIVHDDGRGIQAQEIAGLHSLGLLGMRERAERLGGTFTIQGPPDDGTIVTVSIPFKQTK